MSVLLYNDWYSSAFGSITWSAPGGGSVSVSDAASLKDPVLRAYAQINYSSLPASSGRYGPIRAFVSSSDWTANAVALLDCTLPDASRIEFDSWTISGSGKLLVGQNFPPARPGIPRHLLIYAPTRALALSGSSIIRIEIDFYLPSPAGSFRIGRYFAGQAADLTLALLGGVSDGAVDYSARSPTAGGDFRTRWRGVARRLSLPLALRGMVPIIGGSTTMIDLLDRIGQSDHVVLWPNATLAFGGSVVQPRSVYGLLQADLNVAHAGANEVTASPVLLESL